MSRLARPVYPAAIQQLLARDTQAHLLADDTGQSAPNAVRLPAGRFDHVVDRGAVRAPQEPHERILATSLGLSRMSSRDGHRASRGGRLFRRRHCLAVDGQPAGLRSLEGESAIHLIMAPDRHRICCRHLSKQPALEQAPADVPDRASLQLGQDGEDAQVFTGEGRLQDGALSIGELHDHGWQFSSETPAGLLRFYEGEPLEWGIGIDAGFRFPPDTCSDRDLKQAASAADA